MKYLKITVLYEIEDDSQVEEITDFAWEKVDKLCGCPDKQFTDDYDRDLFCKYSVIVSSHTMSEETFNKNVECRCKCCQH